MFDIIIFFFFILVVLTDHLIDYIHDSYFFKVFMFQILTIIKGQNVNSLQEYSITTWKI